MRTLVIARIELVRRIRSRSALVSAFVGPLAMAVVISLSFGGNDVSFDIGVADNAYFSLRVGYGNAYDETTERRYDQLREFALRPYRLVLFLEAGRADLALALMQADEAA